MSKTKKEQKFKIGQTVKFVGGAEIGYHEDFLKIMNKEGIVTSYSDFMWPYDIIIDGKEYPVKESEI